MMNCSAGNRAARRRRVCLLLIALAGQVDSPAAFAQPGFVDTSFLNGMSGPDSWLWAAALQPDGKLLFAFEDPATSQFAQRFFRVFRGP